jgi:hypothetical protein
MLLRPCDVAADGASNKGYYSLEIARYVTNGITAPNAARSEVMPEL